MPIGKLPHYDADVDAAGPPRSVARFKAAIEAADGLVVATPEYNAGVSGVLKNAIDWASRPAYQSPLVGKPVLLIGATPGRGGARRALEELRRELESTRAEPLPRSLRVASVHEKLGGDTILDPETRRSLAELLVELRDEIARRKAGEEATEEARRGAASRAS
jgi:chromate reductase